VVVHDRCRDGAQIAAGRRPGREPPDPCPALREREQLARRRRAFVELAERDRGARRLGPVEPGGAPAATFSTGAAPRTSSFSVSPSLVASTLSTTFCPGSSRLRAASSVSAKTVAS